MKALILAAGFGSRLMPLTADKPKCMVEYKSRALIDYEISALKAAGAKEIAVVGGYKFEILKEFLRSKFHIQSFFENANYARTNMVQTLFCASSFLQKCIEEKEDLIISYADIIYTESVVKRLVEREKDFVIIVDKAWQSLWQRRFEDVLEDAETLKMSGGKIKELGKKPKNLSEIEAQYTGLFKFSHTFLGKVLSCFKSLDRSAKYDGKDFDNMYMTSFLQILIDKFDNAYALEIEGGWGEIDFKKDLDIDFL